MDVVKVTSVPGDTSKTRTVEGERTMRFGAGLPPSKERKVCWGYNLVMGIVTMTLVWKSAKPLFGKISWEVATKKRTN